MNGLPGEAESIENAGAEIFHHHVTLLEQRSEYLSAHGVLHVHRYGALVAVEHGEVQAVGIGDIAQLATRDVARRGLEFDYVRSEPCHQLRCGGSGLDMGHIQYASTREDFVDAHDIDVPSILFG